MQHLDLIDQEMSDERAASTSQESLSWWTRSRAKRLFDIASVVVFLPVLVPMLSALAFAILVTSGSPVIFRQRRAGKNGRHFAIYKFRTMKPEGSPPPSAISIESADRITWIGTFLRKTKLDELPQVLNILAGDMSLVGPRPKVPEQQLIELRCRPGLTGPATLAFAREDTLLLQIPKDQRTAFYYEAVLPAKQLADSEYLRRASMASDFGILLNTVLGRWDAYGSNATLAVRIRRYEEASNEANAL